MGPFSIPKGNPLFPLDPDHLARGGHRGLPGVLQGVLEEGIVPGGEGGSSRTGWRERSSPETRKWPTSLFLGLGRILEVSDGGSAFSPFSGEGFWGLGQRKPGGSQIG